MLLCLQDNTEEMMRATRVLCGIGAVVGLLWSGQARAAGGEDRLAYAQNLVHGCVVDTSGQLKCWPHIHPEAPIGPQAIKGAADVRALGMARQGTCVVLGDARELWCAGDVVHTVQPDAPYTKGPGALRQVKEIPGKIMALDGADHLCALNALGDVYCWGEDVSGRLGVGAAKEQSAPHKISGLPKITKLAVGWSHACALDETGAVWCWGDNSDKQLDGELSDASSARPIKVEHVKGASWVEAADNTSCAVIAGRVRCWGQNYSIKYMLTPEPETSPWMDISGLDGVEQMVCAQEHAEDRLSRSSPYCHALGGGRYAYWTNTLFGAREVLDEGWMAENVYKKGGTDYAFVPSNEEVVIRAKDGAVETLSVSDHRQRVFWALWPATLKASDRPVRPVGASCMTKGDGQVWCRRTTPQGKSVEELVKGVKGAVALHEGQRHGCALGGAGEVWCWGDNRRGQLGAGPLKAKQPARRVGGLGPVKQLATGATHTCALEERGRLMCWGECEAGVCPGLTGVKKAPTAAPGLEGARRLWATSWHTCAELADGATRCFGRSQKGGAGIDGAWMRRDATSWSEHGLFPSAQGVMEWRAEEKDGQITELTVQTGVKDFQQAVYNFTGSFSMLSRDGHVWRGPWRTVTSKNLEDYKQVDGLDSVVQITQSGEQLCALRADRTVACYTNARDGVSGDGYKDATTRRRFAENPTFTHALSEVKGLTDVRQIAAYGYATMCALRGDGTVWCWGDGAWLHGSFQLELHAPIKLVGLSDVVRLEEDQMYAVLKDGTRRKLAL
jgi:alpha-tubulin suppressor-like RCC1 family protein